MDHRFQTSLNDESDPNRCVSHCTLILGNKGNREGRPSHQKIGRIQICKGFQSHRKARYLLLNNMHEPIDKIQR